MEKIILNYEEFLVEMRETLVSTENQLNETLNQIFEMFNDDNEFVMTENRQQILFKTISEHCILSTNESLLLEQAIKENNYMLAEGIFSKIADKAKEIMAKVADSLKSAGKELITGLINDGKKAANTSKDELETKVSKMGSETKKSLIEEAKNVKDTIGFFAKWCTDGIVKLAQSAYGFVFKSGENLEDEAKKESFSIYDDVVFYALIETIKENKYSLSELNVHLDETLIYLNENNIIQLYESDEHHGPEIPFLGTIVKFLQKAPIFKQLAQVEEKIADLAKNTLHKASAWCKSLGGPGIFEFVVLATLIGLAGEQVVKIAAKSVITSILPGLGPILGVIKSVALAVSIVATIQHLLKDGGDEHGEEKHGH